MVVTVEEPCCAGRPARERWKWCGNGACSDWTNYPTPENAECQTCNGFIDPDDDLAFCPECSTPENVEEPMRMRQDTPRPGDWSGETW